MRFRKKFHFKISNLPYFTKWLILGIIIGVLSGFASTLLYYSVELSEKFFLGYLLGMHIPRTVGDGGILNYSVDRIYLIPLVVIAGAFISSLLVYKFAPEAEGDSKAIEAYHQKQGKIRWRVAPVKLVASAIVIGSGGSAGREGPSSQISAGLGAMVADILKLNSEDRRKMVAIGIGAGIGTIFKSPIAGALIAAEILYRRDFEPDVIYPAIVASATGYSILGIFYGFTPIFGYYLSPFNPVRLPMYAVLGIVAGLMAILYPKSFYYVQSRFSELKVNRYFKPAIGAAITGLIALPFPEIMASGYGWVQILMDQKFDLFPTFGMPVLVVLFAIPFIKIFATSMTIGSGGSGGLFAPGIFTGAFIGADIGIIFHFIFPAQVPTIAPFVIVGMLAFYGAAAKIPVSVILMVVEMTGGLQLLPAEMIAVSISYLVSGNHTIYHAQVPTRKDSPAHAGEYNVPILTSLKITDIENLRNLSINPEADIKEAKAMMTQNSVSSLAVSNQGHFLGAIYMYDIYQLNDGKVRTFMKTGVASVRPNSTLEEAWEIMNTNKSTWVPVVLNGAFLGIVTMTDILDIYRSKLKSLGISGESGG
ncbi:chloride channel protein [Athalassotoga saccharophila]|uniref:chloride channel protein n=1 Tax=Athalassotoga saccharophila TaxID=1441386 RepID=UPI00137A388B|nr:chloride channel protein [Athalassotoga saccharophila]BBJ27933.1 chloride channel protein [Athalassotoga saccharophila]